MPVHSKKQVQIGVLLFNKTFTEVFAEYFNYCIIFSVKNAARIKKNIRVNEYVIILEEDKQLPLA